MRIWLVQTGEEMPFDGPNTRLLRTALLANVLVGRGHDVSYINASFNHQRKEQRSLSTKVIPANEAAGHGYRSILLAGRAYSRNVSLARFLSHRENARSFAALAPKLERPDVIYCGYPPVELANEAVMFARRHKIPVAVDCRDMWPEVIADRLPTMARWLATPMLYALEQSKCATMRHATALTGITDDFVSWGLKAAGRSPQPLDRSFHLAVSSEQLSKADFSSGQKFWDDLLGPQDKSIRVGCFAGTLSQRLDLMTMLDGLDILLPSERENVRIVLCGNGDLEAIIKARAVNNSALVFGGWRDRAQLAALMDRSDFGLLPYPNTTDFLASYPNKVGEYLLAGLPIMTGLEGATGRLLDSASVRLPFRAGDPESFATAIRKACSLGALDTLQDKARAVGISQFDPNRIYPAFADWLEAVANQKEIAA